MKKSIQISEINIVPIRPNEGLVAFASFVIDNNFFVSSVGVYTRLNGEGYRLTYPQRKVGEKNISVFCPINAEVGNFIEQEVNKKVNNIFNKNVWQNNPQNN